MQVQFQNMIQQYVKSKMNSKDRLEPNKINSSKKKSKRITMNEIIGEFSLTVSSDDGDEYKKETDFQLTE